MPADRSPKRGGAEREPRLEVLLPPQKPATAAEAVERMGLWERPGGPGDRPLVLMNMVSSVDGHATLKGRSAPLSGSADRALFHALRAAVDGILVGAGTVRQERYGRLITSEQTRRLRRERGLPEEPLACIVSGRVVLDPDIPLLGEPDARVAILTASAASLPASGAHVDYVRCEREGKLDLEGALVKLRERFGVQVLLCEGGPHLARELVAAGLVDELFLSLAPLLAGGEPASGAALGILAGGELDPVVALELRGVMRHSATVFLRYAVASGALVARETMLRSSLAS